MHSICLTYDDLVLMSDICHAESIFMGLSDFVVTIQVAYLDGHSI
jgi:hypothetical protein